MKTFFNFIQENLTTTLTKEEVGELLVDGKLDPYLIHFSESDTFPPQERRGSSAYTNMDGGSVGASVYLPKVGLFLWRVREFKDKLIKIFKNELTTAGVSGLFSKRKFCYFAKISSSAEVLTFSKYTQTDLERDLKKLNFNFLWSKTNFSENFLEAFEFSHPELINPSDIRSSLSLPQMLKGLLGDTEFNELYESHVPGDPRKIRLRILPPATGFSIIVQKAVQKKLISPESIVYLENKTSKVDSSFLSAYDFVTTPLIIDIKATTEKIRATIDPEIFQTDHLFKITPEQYIEAFTSFVKKHSKLNQEIKDHPALKIWLTVLFFSAANGSSWKALWNEILGYDVLVDDDETLKVIPGIEKVVIARPQIGVEKTMLSRLDNEGTQVIILDNSIFTDIIRVKIN